MSEPSEANPVPPDQEMPTGAMEDSEPQPEQDEMPSGVMEPGDP